MKPQLDFSIVMPCLNEERTLGLCIKKARKSFQGTSFTYEIIVADNGSTDDSLVIARKLKAKIVNVKQKGYGMALNSGISHASGKYVIMGDSDDSYDFSKLKPFLAKLVAGNDLVIGNRFKGQIKKGAMPVLHQLIGNPLFSFMGRLFFGAKVGDFYCGLRGFSKEAWKKMNLYATGMEYAIEMVIKATLLKMKIVEVPIVLHKDGRLRKPHLKTWQDGWRTLRFILLYSPSWLFYFPGVLLAAFGLVLFALALFSTRNVFGIYLDVHTLLVSSALLLIGLQIVLFGMFTKVLISKLKLLPVSAKPTLSRTTSAKMFLSAILFAAIGFIILIRAVVFWYQTGFGELDYSSTMRIVIPSVFFLQLGAQLFFNGFFLDVLLMPNKGIKSSSSASSKS